MSLPLFYHQIETKQNRKCDLSSMYMNIEAGVIVSTAILVGIFISYFCRLFLQNEEQNIFSLKKKRILIPLAAYSLPELPRLQQRYTSPTKETGNAHIQTLLSYLYLHKDQITLTLWDELNKMNKWNKETNQTMIFPDCGNLQENQCVPI